MEDKKVEKLTPIESKQLHKGIEKAEQKITKKIIEERKITDIMKIVENFIRDKKLIYYGGTAINNILSKKFQFYTNDFYIPDYDFFSTRPIQHAKTLANKFYKAGFNDVEAKAGAHKGTFKIYVNFVPVADITYLHKDIFNKLLKNSKVLDKIHYAPPNYLRMSMYSELSQPENDVSRWEKVLGRLNLLNKEYPILKKDCNLIKFQNNFENDKENLYNKIKNLLIDEKVIFFGGFAFNLLSSNVPKNKRKTIKNPYFDVLSETPKKVLNKIKDKLKSFGEKNISIIYIKGIEGIFPKHYEISLNNIPICYIYKPINCYAYNNIRLNNKLIKIATIDTILSFYLLFSYINKPYYNKDRLLCMAHYLFKLQIKKKNTQSGLLKRFVSDCYGKQKTIHDIRQYKSNNYDKLKKKKNKEYLYNFFRYYPKKSIKKNFKNLNNNTKKKNNKNTKKKNNKNDKIKKSLIKLTKVFKQK